MIEVESKTEVEVQKDHFSRRLTSRFAGLQGNREMLPLVVASLLATIPVWVASFPPMTDLPQHAAQVAMFRNLHDPSFNFSGLFTINWFTPYLFGYLAIYALTPLVGIVAACKIVVSLALAGLPLATSMLMKETGADRYWALLSIGAMYGFTYEWGFLNFLVAAPIGILFLVFVMRHARKPSLASSLWLGFFAVMLFFCHALICCFFGLIACLYSLVETVCTSWPRNGASWLEAMRKAVITISPMASVLPIMLVWYLRIRSNPVAQQPTVWDLGWIDGINVFSLGGRLTGFIPRLLGMKGDAICIMFGISLFALPLLAGARPARHLSVWVPFALCLAVLLFFPSAAFGTAFVFQRFAVFSLPLFLVGMTPSSGKIRPAWRGGGILVVLALLTITTARTMSYDAEARSFNTILSKMEPGQRALSLIFVRQSDSIPAPLFLHFPAWYSATKNGMVDPNFAAYYTQLVVFKPSKTPGASLGFEWFPQLFDWDEMRGGDYRYFVARAPIDVGSGLFRNARCRIRLAAREDSWWLYEVDPQCSSVPNTTF